MKFSTTQIMLAIVLASMSDILFAGSALSDDRQDAEK